MIKIIYEWIMQLLIKMYNKSINKKIIPKKKKKKKKKKKNQKKKKKKGWWKCNTGYFWN